MKMLMLRFTKLNNVEGDWWDSNLIILNGPSGVHIEMPAIYDWYEVRIKLPRLLWRGMG